MKDLRNLIRATPALVLATLQAVQAAPPANDEGGTLRTLRSDTAKPYTQNAGSFGATPHAYGPGSGVLGITSIAATNSGSNLPAYAVIFSAAVVGPNCDSPVLNVVNFRLPIYVQPLSTLQLTFPSPLFFPAVNGLTCYGVAVTQGSLELLFNGFVN